MGCCFMTKQEVFDEVIEILIKKAMEDRFLIYKASNNNLNRKPNMSNSRGEKENGVYSSSGHGKQA